MRRSPSLAAALLSLTLIAGCSFTPQPPDPSEIALQSVDLYYNRASLEDISFEQFKLVGHTLLAECGSLAGGRHSTKQRLIIEVDDETLGTVKQEAWAVRRYVNELDAKFKDPGGVSSIIDPGKLTLKLTFDSGTTSVITSFDSIAEGTADKEAAVGRVARSIRDATGGTLCGQFDFYGIEGSRNILQSD